MVGTTLDDSEDEMSQHYGSDSEDEVEQPPVTDKVEDIQAKM